MFLHWAVLTSPGYTGCSAWDSAVATCSGGAKVRFIGNSSSNYVIVNGINASTTS